MKKFIHIALTLGALYPFTTVLSMEEPYEVDVRKSKMKFLISDGKSAEERKRENEGVMTLCFKKVGDGWFAFDHAALVFEFFESESSDISLRLIHYGREATCWGCIHSGKEQVLIEGVHSTLRKVYREKRTQMGGATEQISPSYLRYACWVLPNNQLKRAIRRAEKEAENVRDGRPSEYYNCVKYVARVMKDAGLNEIELGFLSKLLLGYWGFGSSLKSLVDSANRQKPDYTQSNMPKLEWELQK